jgi:hypothetical protein
MNMKVKVSELKDRVNAGVAKLGYQGNEAKVISETLLYAQLRGNNQGITKIATGGVPKASEVEEYRVVKQNKVGALVSGGHAMVATDNASDSLPRLRLSTAWVSLAPTIPLLHPGQLVTFPARSLTRATLAWYALALRRLSRLTVQLKPNSALTH